MLVLLALSMDEPERADLRVSHFVLGYDDAREARSKSVHGEDFVPFCSEVYREGSYFERDSSVESRRQHFSFSDGNRSCTPNSTSHEVYAHPVGLTKANLSEVVRSDLRASHFSIGTQGCACDWKTSHREEYGFFSDREARSKPCVETGRRTAIFGSSIQKDDYLSESKSRFVCHKHASRTQMAADVKEDLRRSHFSHAMNFESDFSTESHSAFRKWYMDDQAHTADQVSQLKAELSKSHLNLWKGSMKGYMSESRSQFVKHVL